MLTGESGASRECRGKTISRLESGKVLHVFPSALPNGSQKTKKAPSVFCLFDAVFSEAEEAYYITDVLAWNGVHLCGADIDSRMTWTRSHFQRCPAAAPPSPAHKYQLHMCDLHVCDAQGSSSPAMFCAIRQCRSVCHHFTLYMVSSASRQVCNGCEEFWKSMIVCSGDRVCGCCPRMHVYSALRLHEVYMQRHSS
jgi:hypothetical protein